MSNRAIHKITALVTVSRDQNLLSKHKTKANKQGFHSPAPELAGAKRDTQVQGPSLEERSRGAMHTLSDGQSLKKSYKVLL